MKTCSRGHTFKGSEPCPLCWPGYRTYEMKSKLWIYPGEAAWHFVTLPKKDSDLIKKRFEGLTRGWGSLPVIVTIGDTNWKTSIFPDKKAGAYLLPIKADVRKKEKLEAGKAVTFSIEIQA